MPLIYLIGALNFKKILTNKRIIQKFIVFIYWRFGRVSSFWI